MAEAIPLLLVVAIPLSVQAGLFSAVLQNLEPEVVVDEHSVFQPADIKILSADLTPNPLLARGGGDIFVTEDGALVPNGLSGKDMFMSDTYKTGEISLYLVKEGDTLSEIAEMFSVTSNTILWANDLANAQAIKPGQTLVILPIVGVQHIVKKGDTVASIAKKYEGDEDEIRAYNQLSTDETLVAGATIVVPGGNMHKVVAATSATSKGEATGSFVHPAPGAKRTQGIHGYNAVDFGGSIGSTVRAAAGGEVIVSKSSGWNGGYGSYIVIRHGNGTQTLYAHLSSNVVGVGATVAAGETIGALGNTGRSTGPHLHFEVRGAKNPF